MVSLISTVAKIGPWGGNYGGADHDLPPPPATAAAPTPHSLRSVSIRAGKVLDSIAFTYADAGGAVHAAGPWGGDGGKLPEEVAAAALRDVGKLPPRGTVNELALEDGERVTEVHGTVGPYGDRDSLVTSLKLVTDRGRAFGPFGYGAGTPFSVPVLGHGGVAAFFVRAGDFVEAVGVYVNPNAAATPTPTPKPAEN
uniref:Jacalin-type lectin domain-containing protein n=1 Tax=Leersia perrieri TaxID=77586 RepID=A0A0D9VV11_9ORYZ